MTERDKIEFSDLRPTLRDKVATVRLFIGSTVDGLVAFDTNKIAGAMDKDIRHRVAYALIPHIWRNLAGIDRRRFINSPLYELFANSYRLVCFYDDLCDERDGGVPLPTKDELASSEYARQLLCSVVNIVHRQLKTPACERIKFIGNLAHFRRQEYEWLQEFEPGDRDWKTFSFDEVVGYKELTGSLNARIASEVCGLPFSEVSQQKKIFIEESMVNALLLMQIADDVRDWREDVRFGNLNYFTSAAVGTGELGRLLGNTDKLPPRSVAPESMEMCDRVAVGYLQKIPSEYRGLKGVCRVEYAKLTGL